MRSIGRVLLRGLMVLLPTVLTVYVCWWLIQSGESLLGGIIPKERYRPGMGLLAAVVLVFVVGLLTRLWLFRWVVDVIEGELNRIPLVKTLFGSIKDLVSFFPGQKTRPGMQKVVLAELGGAQILGIVVRETFVGLPEAFSREGEVLVYLPVSYQLGGHVVWMKASSLVEVKMSVPDAMRFAMTGGMSTTSGGQTAHPASST